MAVYPFSPLAVFKIFLLSLIFSQLTAGCDFLSFFPVLGWLCYLSHELLYQFVNILSFFFLKKLLPHSLSPLLNFSYIGLSDSHMSPMLCSFFFFTLLALVGYFLLISSSSLIWCFAVLSIKLTHWFLNFKYCIFQF